MSDAAQPPTDFDMELMKSTLAALQQRVPPDDELRAFAEHQTLTHPARAAERIEENWSRELPSESGGDLSVESRRYVAPSIPTRPKTAEEIELSDVDDRGAPPWRSREADAYKRRAQRLEREYDFKRERAAHSTGVREGAGPIIGSNTGVGKGTSIPYAVPSQFSYVPATLQRRSLDDSAAKYRPPSAEERFSCRKLAWCQRLFPVRARAAMLGASNEQAPQSRRDVQRRAAPLETDEGKLNRARDLEHRAAIRRAAQAAGYIRLSPTFGFAPDISLLSATNPPVGPRAIHREPKGRLTGEAKPTDRVAAALKYQREWKGDAARLDQECRRAIWEYRVVASAHGRTTRPLT